MFTSCFGFRERPKLKTAVLVTLFLFVLPHLSACSSTSAPVTAPPTSVGQPLASPLAEKLDTWLSSQVAKSDFKGAVLVANGDEVILARGYGMADEEAEILNDPATKFRIAAITMPFTATAILQLQELELLDVADPICTYLDNCPDTWANITIHHLLTHSSGIQGELETYMMTPTPPDQLLTEARGRPLQFPPGTRWEYSDFGYLLLGQIIERVSGKSYADFLQENYFDPLEMAGTGMDLDAEGLAVGYEGSVPAEPFEPLNLHSARGMYSTVEDLYRWIRALEMAELISQPTLDLISSKHVPIYKPWDIYEGYGWQTMTIAGHPAVRVDGAEELLGVNNYVARFPEDGLIIIVLSNQNNLQSEQTVNTLAEMVFDEA